MISRSDFRSMGAMAQVIAHNLWRIPRDTGLVVAIPESGRLPAAFIGLQTGRPVLDLDHALAAPADGKPILLVDDISLTGASMARARARLAEAQPGRPVTTLAVFAQAPARDAVDLAFEVGERPVIGEWNLFRSWIVEHACFDMDGILCGDCPVDDDDDGPRYRDFLERASPLVVPRGRLRRIVTARLEKYRPATEAWLARNGIRYEALVMLDLPSEAERRRLSPQARFKAEAYRADPEALLFVESEGWQAREIALRSGGKLVFDYQNRQLLDSILLAERSLRRRLRRRVSEFGRRLFRTP